MILRDEAIITRIQNYSDSSVILTLHTLTKGRMAAIVKGARTLKKTKKSLPIYPAAIVQAVIYIKETREVQQVTEISATYIPYQVLNSPVKQLYIQLLLEIFNKAIPEKEESPQTHELLAHTIHTINDEEGCYLPFIQYLMGLMQILGCLPQADATLHTPRLDTEKGIFVPTTDASIQTQCHAILHDLLLNRQTASVAKQYRNPLIQEMLRFLTYHTNINFQNIKTLNVFHEIFHSS